jgi:hypothetical protein
MPLALHNMRFDFVIDKVKQGGNSAKRNRL